jgi:hypothetical protein
MAYTNFPNGITSFGVPIFGGGQDISGKTYFVDGNRANSGGDGSSWDKAYKTLAPAIAASQANIALSSNRAWAKRNTIYAVGDWLEETLVAFPQKTDIIGVGSCDGFKGVGITGLHVPIGGTFGTRWFNTNFRSVGTGTLITLASTCIANEFYNCMFHGNGSTSAAAIGVDATASNFLKFFNCDFSGAFTGNAVDIGAGKIDDLRFIGNRIMGAAHGFVVTDTTTVTGSRLGLVANNHIRVTGKAIDDGADSTIVVTNNMVISATADGANAYVITAAFAAGNIITANGVDITRF